MKLTMCIFFILMDFFLVGIAYAVYGKKRSYSEGMLLGVHLPRSAADSEAVISFMETYRRKSVRFYAWNGIIGAGICLLNFWYLSVFMIVWSIWMLEFFGGAVAILFRSHRKLYDMKVEHGWIGAGGSRIMAADTCASAKAGVCDVSPRWHLLFCALLFLPCLVPGVRGYLSGSDDGWMLLAAASFAGVLFAVIHAVILRMRNRIYSEDSSVNLKVNRMQKNTWSWALVGCGLLNAGAYLFIASFMEEGRQIGAGPYVIYVILQSVSPLFLLGAFFYISVRKKALLEKNPRPLYIDDDEYWKNGWYSNPNDRKLLVQDWACSWNYTTNMGRPAGKIFMAAGILVTVICLVFMCGLMLYMEFTPLTIRLEESQLEISSGYYDKVLDYGDITGVKLLDELPEEHYRKVNGLKDESQMVGKFRGSETGKCIMCLWIGYTPVLELQTDDGPVYMNSRDPEETEEWMREITVKIM